MFETGFPWLLVPAAGAFGWAWARRTAGARNSADPLRSEAIAGLSSLVRDDADQAIAALSRAIEAEPGAVELQLSLGGLFRRKGEIDRAILLHEALLVRGGLDLEQTAKIRLALAQDYLKAGVLDRAEAHAEALVERGVETAAALELLLDLHEQARDWPRAIDTARRWQAVRGTSAAARIAQYHCEMAEQALMAKDSDAALAAVEQALDADPACVRASLLGAAADEARGEPSAAFDRYARVFQQAPAFIGEALAGAQRCAVAVHREPDFRELIELADAVPKPAPAVSLAKARLLAAAEGNAAAAAYLAQRLQQGMGGEGALLWLEFSGAVATDDAVWTPIRASLMKRIGAGPRYRCGNCGFSPSLLFWQCPSCKSWGSVRPADTAV